jgi:hypothetical protein
MAEHKPDKSLVETPVEYICGDPGVRDGAGTTDTIYGLQGPEGVSANGGIKFNLIRTDLTSSPSDEPSDAKQFKGQSSD